MGTASGHHYVVDRCRQLSEEPLDLSRVGSVEDSGAERFELERGILESPGVASRENDLGAVGACPSSCFEPDAGANHCQT